MAFLFAAVQAATQAWAKADLARARPDLRSAYARPGLVTWKSEGAIDPAAPIETPFARVWGAGIGTATLDELDAIARAEGARCLHVFARDARDRDEPPDEDRARAAAIERALRAGGTFREGSVASEGERVLDVIVGGDDPPYVGLHVHGPGRIAHPGGRFPDLVIPADSPSRADRKLEEMLAWSGLAPRPGVHAVEIGAAPGGAAYALARRGVHVTAIDPAAIDPGVLAYRGPGGARVVHLPVPAGGVRAQDLPTDARWLLCDVNLAPPVMLRYLERIAAKLPALHAMIVTMKINDARVAADIPRLLARVGAIAGGPVRAIQLAAHRREIGVVAIRASGRPARARDAGGRAARARPAGAGSRAPRTR